MHDIEPWRTIERDFERSPARLEILARHHTPTFQVHVQGWRRLSDADVDFRDTSHDQHCLEAMMTPSQCAAVLRPVRRILPDFGNVDLSPLVVFLLIRIVIIPLLFRIEESILVGSIQPALL